MTAFDRNCRTRNLNVPHPSLKSQAASEHCSENLIALKSRQNARERFHQGGWDDQKHQQKSHDNKTATERRDSDQLHSEIEQLAYKFYCECGNEHGHDHEHWAEAERRVRERHEGQPASGR